MPYISIMMAGTKLLWGNRHNHCCDVADYFSSGVYCLYLYICPLCGHLLREEKRKGYLLMVTILLNF